MIDFIKNVFGWDWTRWVPVPWGKCDKCGTYTIAKSYHESGHGVRLRCVSCDRYFHSRKVEVEHGTIEIDGRTTSR